MSSPIITRIATIASLLFFAVGCGGAAETEGLVTNPSNIDVPDGDHPPRVRYNNLGSSTPTKTFDLNHDGKEDQIHYSVDGELQRVVRDLNFDGVADVHEYYREGRLHEEELDLDLDGAIDVVRFYEKSGLSKKSYAMGFRSDMVIARWYDAGGNLIRVERDTASDGKVDTWEHYAPGSKTPHKVEVDRNQDGKPDAAP